MQKKYTNVITLDKKINMHHLL